MMRKVAASKCARNDQAGLKLLVLDTSYTFEMIQDLGIEKSVTCRDLDGFFRHVWTVHPFASMLTSESWAAKYGRAVHHRVTLAHTFIEGKLGRFRLLHRISPLNFLIAQVGLFFSLARLIKKERISFIRTGDPHYLGLFGLGLARLCGVPVLIRVGANYDVNRATSGGPIQPRLLRSEKVEKAIERFVFKRVDLVAGANQDNLDFALANGARAEFSTLFRYGNLIDRRHFAEPASRFASPARFSQLAIQPGKFLLTVARLEVTNSLKHPDDVVRVLARLRERGHDVKAVLAGEGRMRGMLVDLARELGVAEHLVLPGNQDQQWLAEMIPHAAAVVSPHAGRALSEAALGAAPVAAYDIDWQRELIETDITGVLVPHRAWEELSSGVERYLNDPVFARSMGDALRQRALNMLDPAKLDDHERRQYLALMERAV